MYGLESVRQTSSNGAFFAKPISRLAYMKILDERTEHRAERWATGWAPRSTCGDVARALLHDEYWLVDAFKRKLANYCAEREAAERAQL